MMRFFLLRRVSCKLCVIFNLVWRFFFGALSSLLSSSKQDYVLYNIWTYLSIKLKVLLGALSSSGARASFSSVRWLLRFSWQCLDVVDAMHKLALHWHRTHVYASSRRADGGQTRWRTRRVFSTPWKEHKIARWFCGLAERRSMLVVRMLKGHFRMEALQAQ